MKTIRKIPFVLLLVLIVVMAIATFIEKSQGTSFVYNSIYGSWWFTLIWGVLTGFSLIALFKGKIYKNIPLALLHTSLIVILAGALCTKLFSTQGQVILNQHYIVNSFYAGNEKIEELPFQLKLDTFYIQYYLGTDSPADYISRLQIMESNPADTLSAKVSMNNILNYGGYRFYQSSFENDGRTSILSVNRDAWGIPLTYTGYALFALSFIWLLFSRNGRYRQLLTHPLIKKTPLLLLLLLPLSSPAQTLSPDSLTVNKEQAERFGKLWMLYEGRITPVSTFARDFTLKLTGKPDFSYLNSEQFFMSFLFIPEIWQKVAIFEIEHEELRNAIGLQQGEKAALIDFFDQQNHYKLASYWDQLSQSNKSPLIKEVEKINDKIQLINMLHSGNLLQLYPYPSNGRISWIYPTQTLPLYINSEDSAFIKKSLVTYYEAIKANHSQEALESIQAIADFQKDKAGEILPSDTKRDMEIFYTKTDVTSILFMANLTFGILALLAFFFLKAPRDRIANKALYILLAISFAVHTLSIGLRTYIGGRLPFSNGFETMLLIAWCAMLIALIFSKKIKIILPFGFLASGCALLVAHIEMMNPKITPLVPVLSSPLLSIHVSTIMISYTLFAFVALNSLVSLLQLAFSNRSNYNSVKESLEQNRIYSLLCLYPALLFLGAGIFIGAIWANVSWGRYWGWDPKETWALITFLVYSFVLHERSLTFLSKPFSFHVFGLLAFSTVLMTYFGVNYFLGGMHSYAGTISLSGLWIAILSVILIAVLAGIGYYKQQKFKS